MRRRSGLAPWLLGAVVVVAAVCVVLVAFLDVRGESPGGPSRSTPAPPAGSGADDASPAGVARRAARAAIEVAGEPLAVPPDATERAAHALRREKTGAALRRCGRSGFDAVVALLREGVNGAPVAIVLAETWSPGREQALFDAAIDRAVPYGSRATAIAALGWINSVPVRNWLAARFEEPSCDAPMAFVFALADQHDQRAIDFLRKLEADAAAERAARSAATAAPAKPR